MSWRRLQNVLRDVFKTSSKTKNCYAEDLLILPSAFSRFFTRSEIWGTTLENRVGGDQISSSLWLDADIWPVTGSSHRKCSVKKDVLKYFPNFTRKHLCWSLFLIKFQAFRPTTLLKWDSNTVVFLWNLRNFWGRPEILLKIDSNKGVFQLNLQNF